MSIDSDGTTWTYGTEHEFGDWDTRTGYKGFGLDPEPEIVNSNGIAADPKLKDCPFGAEINTAPSDTIDGQVEQYIRFTKAKQVYVSYRVGMHIHIRIPGLKDDVAALKKIQRFVTDNHDIWKRVDPLPNPSPEDYSTDKDFALAKKWIQRLRRSHLTRIPDDRVSLQMKARTPRQFLDAEAKINKLTGEKVFFLQPRATVNLRQLDQTDTIEFRPFMQATKSIHVKNAADFCKAFLLAALNDGDIDQVYEDEFSEKEFPPLPEFQPWMERRWMATAHSLNNRETVRKNIELILKGKFDSVSNRPFAHLRW